MSETSSDKIANWTLAVSAAIIAAVVLFQVTQAERPRDLAVEGGERAAKFVSDWKQGESKGIRIYGPESAPVVLIEFGDLECPACRGFQSTIHKLVQKHPETLKVVYVPFPLPMHRFALPAARGMECADSLGAATQWLEAVYEVQDSLGLLSWDEIAKRAAITPSAPVVACANSAQSFSKIDASTAFALDHQIAATPTIWVNGWQFRGGLTFSKLDSLVSSLAIDESTKK